MNGAPFSLAKSVQELSISGELPPPRFSVKDECNHSSIPFAEIPLIDLRLLSEGSQNELIKLRSALTSWGCFQAIGHQISSSLLDDMRNQVRQFFSLSMEEKKQYSRQAGEEEGYGNDHVFSEKQVLDWCDRVILKLLPKDKRNLKFWPKNPTSFREVVHDYSIKMEAMIHLLLKAMARSLDLGEESFLSRFGERATMLGRFNLYPVCSQPEGVMGAKAHSDSSGITIVLPDTKVLGLQVFKDDKWYTVPVVSEAFLVNLGGQLQIMSNGILKSPLHRVAASSERDRISTVIFYGPEEHTEIGPIEELISESQPRLYRNVKNYAAINKECFQTGKNPLDTLKL